MIGRVAIVGSGFSGTLQALNLLQHDGPDVVLIERGDHAGMGVAFGSADPNHLLNVRAANMSAFPDRPGHFVEWLETRGAQGVETTFVPRKVYGEYLAEMLAAARSVFPERLTVVKGEAVDMAEAADVDIRLACGRSVSVDAVVLAVGNLPPHDPSGWEGDALPGTTYQRDPWAADPCDDLCDTDTILLLGTGLTMVDVALTLKARRFAGRIVALSRRGLLPRSHEASQRPVPRLAERPRHKPSQLVRGVRTRAREVGWRNAVDELRPHTQTMWAAAGYAERSRFLRHLRPWWDVHRHRLAPPVADQLAAMQAEGRLTVIAGKTIALAEREDGLDVVWRTRGTEDTARMSVRRIINCTGPLGDLSRTREPLLRALVARGTIRPDVARLGIDVDRHAAVIGIDGTRNPRVSAVGPMTRGAFWEIVAVPDIRMQVWTLARRLTNAHWIEGEGL